MRPQCNRTFPSCFKPLFQNEAKCLQNLICLLLIFADQVFIEPTFFGIFVCGPLQSFVVNICAKYKAVDIK